MLMKLNGYQIGNCITRTNPNYQIKSKWCDQQQNV